MSVLFMTPKKVGINKVKRRKFLLVFRFKPLHGPTAQNKHGAHYAGFVESDER
jgi:hypothetical protein